MKKFLDEAFLLETETARHLYHTFAAGQPIVDGDGRRQSDVPLV